MSTRVEHLLEHRTPLAAKHTDDSGAGVWLITYPDQFVSSRQAPLAELHELLSNRLADHVDGVHLLPFHPSSSDGGFAVIDYGAVSDDAGTWDDVRAIGADTTLMVDAVINHLSAESTWFGQFLAGDPERAGYFRVGDPSVDHTAVVRPRTHPLFTTFERADGTAIDVWTTFSADQVDLDFANPEVFLAMLEVLLDYVAHGASAIRLDAVGFVWKDESTTSIHLRQTHDLIKLFRSCLDHVAPGIMLISETNVPHEENISYLDPVEPEVHAVYQFPLAPLVAHAVLTGRTRALTGWAGTIDEVVGPQRTFLNFLASHDGIGVRPAEGILEPDDIELLRTACVAGGGQISERSLPDGSTVPYELNTTWFDLMAHGVDEATAIARHLAAHAVMLALPGYAAIYVHSLIGSGNDQAGYEASGHKRDLNRARFTDGTAFETRIGIEGSREQLVFEGLHTLISARKASPAFHPEGRSSVLETPDGVVAIERNHDGHRAVCIVNLTDRPQPIDSLCHHLVDLLTGSPPPLELDPYQSAWLAP